MFEISLVTGALDKALFLTEELEDRIEFFNTETVPNRNFFIAVDPAKKIVGLIAFVEKSFFKEDCLGLAYLSIDPEFRNRGLASKLATELFNYARTQSKGISISWYEPMGEQYLKPVMQRIAAATPEVPLFERN